MGFFDLVANCVELGLFVDVDNVVFVRPDDRPICRNDDNIEIVDLPELFGLGLGGSRHAGDLVVHPEEVMKGYRREGTIPLGDLYPFFRLDGLVKAL